MYQEFKDGETVEVGGLQCHLPPVGFGIREERDERGNHKYILEKTEILPPASAHPLKQFWVPTDIPDWYVKAMEAEQEMQEDDRNPQPHYVNKKCEAFREQEWGRRLRGVWFWNKGRLVYITGMHYVYIQYWVLPDGGRPLYRECDRLFFYFLQYCIEDPDCLGMLSVAKRKSGKTARSGIFVYEYVSRQVKVRGGIQSRSDEEAKEVYLKAVMQPWQQLPHFFRPIYDTTGGDAPDKGIEFAFESRRGKNAGQKQERFQFLGKSKFGLQVQTHLQSLLNFKSRQAGAYDGPHLHRYVSDECGKLKDVDINKRHNIVRFCSYVNGRHIGKHLYTTTVEEIEDGGVLC